MYQINRPQRKKCRDKNVDFVLSFRLRNQRMRFDSCLEDFISFQSSFNCLIII